MWADPLVLYLALRMSHRSTSVMLTHHRPHLDRGHTFLGGDESVLCNKPMLWAVRVTAVVTWGVLVADALPGLDVVGSAEGRLIQLVAAMSAFGLLVLAAMRPFHEIAEVFYDAGRRDERKRWLGKGVHPLSRTTPRGHG